MEASPGGLRARALYGARVGWRPFLPDDRVASVRLRSLLPCRYLSAAGVHAQVIEPGSTDRLDAVVFQKTSGREDLAFAERLVDRGTTVVFDLCDNHFWNPDGNAELAERARRVRAMIELADLVTVSTPELGRTVADETGRPSVVVDDALELPVLSRLRLPVPLPPLPRAQRPTRLVWFGNAGSDNPPFGLVHLVPLLPELARLHADSLPLSLTVVTNSAEAFDRIVAAARPGFPVRFVPWRPATFAAQLRRHDVTVIPVEANPFTVCKSSNRPLLSLALGVPVVASELPAYQELAPWILFEEWARSITRYARDPDLAAGHVAGAQAYIRDTYRPYRVVDQWAYALVEALSC